MAKSFKELTSKSEDLIEQGREADQRVQSCQAAVSAAQSRVAAARSNLAAASMTDENGEAVGDVGAAQAELAYAESILEESERELASARDMVDRIRGQKAEHARAIESYEAAERSNIEKLKRLRELAFPEIGAEAEASIASRLNEAENSRVALLRSMGESASPEYVSVSSGGSADRSWGGGARGEGYRGMSEGLPSNTPAAAPAGGALGGLQGGAGMPNGNSSIKSTFRNLAQTQQTKTTLFLNGRYCSVFDHPFEANPQRICNQGSAYPNGPQNTCGCCASGTIENKAGGKTTEREIVSDALRKGFCDSEGYTTSSSITGLLSSRGIPSTDTSGTRLCELADKVEQGHGVIIAVEARRFDPKNYSSAGGHALVLESVIRDSKTNEIIEYVVIDSNRKDTSDAAIRVDRQVLESAFSFWGSCSITTDNIIW